MEPWTMQDTLFCTHEIVKYFYTRTGRFKHVAPNKHPISTPFLFFWDGSEIWHTCPRSPCQAVEVFFLPDTFIWGIWVLRDPNFRRKNNAFFNGWEGAHRTRVKFQGLSKTAWTLLLGLFCADNILWFALLPCNYLISGSISQKRRRHWTLKEIWGDTSLNQLVHVSEILSFFWRSWNKTGKWYVSAKSSAPCILKHRYDCLIWKGAWGESKGQKGCRGLRGLGATSYEPRRGALLRRSRA